jgi:hypothetical protein
LVNEAAGPPQDPVARSRGTAIAQAYYYVVAAIGLIFVLGGTIAALIAVRRWILPAGDPSGFFGPADENDAPRSLLGALSFAIPGALVLVWHLREARRREGHRGPPSPWGSALYLYLVALISLAIALGGVVAMGHALRDSVLPVCYDTGFEGPVTIDPGLGPGFEDGGSPIPPIELPADFAPEVLRSEECYPSSSEALRSALDAGIVTGVAGAVWLWHLRRARRAPDEAHES